MPNNENGKTSKRRLPVVQSSGATAEDGAEPRPPWHWVGFGAVTIFIVWLPLAWGAEAISRHLVAGKLGTGETRLADLSRGDRFTVLAMLAAPQAVALIAAGFAGGFLVTRFGQGTRRRDSTFAGLAVGLLALGLTYSQVGLSLAALVVPLLAAASASAGGLLGARRQR